MPRTFPSNLLRMQRKAESLLMPAPQAALVDGDAEPWIAVEAEFAAQRTDPYQRIRLMVLAVLKLFGGHRPTRGDDPPGGAARPFKIERLNAIANRRQAGIAFERMPANPKHVPYAAAA
jgi:hypothetical protein